MKFAALIGLLAAAALLSQSGRDNRQPHEIKFCKPSATGEGATCKCLGMVSDVQAEATADCYKAADIKACLAAVPDHCQIVSYDAPHEKHFGKNGERRCRTTCKPERCKCADTACKSHEDSGQ